MWYTIPYYLQPNYTRNVSMLFVVCVVFIARRHAAEMFMFTAEVWSEHEHPIMTRSVMVTQQHTSTHLRSITWRVYPYCCLNVPAARQRLFILYWYQVLYGYVLLLYR